MWSRNWNPSSLALFIVDKISSISFGFLKIFPFYCCVLLLTIVRSCFCNISIQVQPFMPAFLFLSSVYSLSHFLPFFFVYCIRMGKQQWTYLQWTEAFQHIHESFYWNVPILKSLNHLWLETFANNMKFHPFNKYFQFYCYATAYTVWNWNYFGHHNSTLAAGVDTDRNIFSAYEWLSQKNRMLK